MTTVEVGLRSRCSVVNGVMVHRVGLARVRARHLHTAIVGPPLQLSLHYAYVKTVARSDITMRGRTSIAGIALVKIPVSLVAAT